jgi:hypothetical protein
MSYLNTLENDWRADKITRDQFVELKRVYNLATPEEKKALEEVRAMGISKFLSVVNLLAESKANKSNSKTPEQKMLEDPNKKVIAIHTLGLIGTVILWFILNEVLDIFLGESYHKYGGRRASWEAQGYWRDHWDTDIDGNGGFLLLVMLIGYIVVYWAVQTIWFTKDKD